MSKYYNKARVLLTSEAARGLVWIGRFRCQCLKMYEIEYGRKWRKGGMLSKTLPWTNITYICVYKYIYKYIYACMYVCTHHQYKNESS